MTMLRPHAQSQSGCYAALIVLGLVLLVGAQRPLNTNVSSPLIGGEAYAAPTVRPSWRGYSSFSNGGGGSGGAAGSGQHEHQLAGGTNRKLNSRAPLNTLDGAKRPLAGGGGGGGSVDGGDGAVAAGINGGGGYGLYQPNGGVSRRKLSASDTGAAGGGGASGMDGLYQQTGRGRKHTMHDLRRNTSRPRERPNDEAVYAVEKNPMHVLKEIFRNDHSIKTQQPYISHQMETVLGVKCSFETACAWTWDEAVTDGFQPLTGSNLTKSNRTGLFPGPVADSRNDANGHFLYLRLTANTTQRSLRSPVFGVSRENCYLQMVVHQSAMQNNSMRLVIEPQNGDAPWVLAEIGGNDGNTWETMRQRISRVTKDFRILFEVVPTGNYKDDERGHIAIDELMLRDCFPEVADNDTCRMAQVRCQKNRQEMCLRTVKVCDLDVDCDGSEDERLNCDKIPFGGRCDFEDGWCGWRNSGRVIMLWERHSGPTPTEKTGPDTDHTMQAARNGSQGHYMFVNMNQHGNDSERKKTVGFASNAVMNSVVFNPPPAVNYNASSPYAHRCMVRFYVHQYGPNTGSVNLSVVEIGERENVTTTLWWSSRDQGPDWRREDLILTNITGRYFLQFEARMGMRIYSDVAIDDFSLAPECFGLNIPVDELNGYNYYDPKLFDNRPAHRDFVNRSVVSLTTCGARGKDGPRVDQCNAAYNQTDMQKSVRLLTEAPHRGVQVWRVPGENYYTIIAKGAGGGLGSAGVGSSRGARAVSVLELHRDEEIHILVGQKGEHACIKSMGYREKECEQTTEQLSGAATAVAAATKTKQVHHMLIEDGAGGGGGGTYAFVLNSVNVAVPLVVAAGGGGLGIGRYLGEHEQHGRPMTGVPEEYYSGQVDGDANRTGGPGGGWHAPPDYELSAHFGAALLDGGRGGEPCYQPRGIHGQGGFGGGGGGCMSGGGGGGYAGGDTDEKLTNGAGGTSYISRSRSVGALSSVSEGDNSGPGSVVIIPALATPACGCDYRCVALDEYSSVVACICPENWRLKKDNLTACEQIGKERPISQNYLIVFFAIVCVTLVIALSGLIFMLYNRYQRKKQAAIRQKMLMEQDLQLARLRNHPDEHNLNAFNPNYGCEGLLNGRVDVRSLPQVTREKLVLMVVLGRGAFGEVYEGVYRHRDGDTPMPVAVKMLPSMSTKCSEEEFIMEASIMAKFSHPNIVHMIGVCFDRHPRYLVIELLAGGDLKKWLRESRDGEGLSMKDLMFCALDVAKGCRYMESRRFIHRDIAARNCLLSSKGPGRVVKIADFGMARDIYRQDYYKKGGRAMLPIKWMPPEAFLDGIFTAKTDVWSYGVLMWEIFSQGILPYASMANAPVMKYVTNNFRLPQPEGCPDAIYGLMQATWSLLPEDRPTFATIIEQIVACTMDGEIMNAPLPEFMRVLKMMGDNGTVLNVPYNPDECERPEVENAEDDPQDYLVPLDAQRRRAAVAHAAAVAAARIGATGGGGGGGVGVNGTVAVPGGVAVPKTTVSAATMGATLLPPSTPNGIADVPFICSDPHCTNTNHILPPSGAAGSGPPGSGVGGGGGVVTETSFSVPKSASNPGDLLPPPPPPSGSAAAAAAALEEAERKLINLDTPQPTPTTIKPPMAFGDRDSSCNSIATITLDPASLEQQHMAASPYMNVPLQQRPAPVVVQLAQPPGGQQALRALKPTSNGYGPHVNGGNGDLAAAAAAATTTAPTATTGGETVGGGPVKTVNIGEENGDVAVVKAGAQQPFTIHGYSKRYKPNENHSEISC